MFGSLERNETYDDGLMAELALHVVILPLASNDHTFLCELVIAHQKHAQISHRSTWGSFIVVEVGVHD